MKKIIRILSLTIPILLISCGGNHANPQKEIIIKQSDIIKRTLTVKGMTCVGCEVTLEENISKIEGVVTTSAAHSDDKVIIEFDSTKTDILTIKSTIEESGYNVY